MRRLFSPVSRDYLLRSILNSFQKKVCPYCKHDSSSVVDRKYVVTRLLQCEVCDLHYRYPKDGQDFFDQFYQTDYEVDNAMITDLPSDEALLLELKANNFAQLRNYAPYLEALRNCSAGQTGKIAEYGCSWGYSLYQRANAGFDVEGCELSRPRAKFGADNLGVRIVTNTSELRTGNDAFFSSHVIEHLADIDGFVGLAKSKLKEDGIFVSFCPNGSPEFRERRPDIFHGGWGLEHINYLTVDFARNLFTQNPYLILTGDWEFRLMMLEVGPSRTK